MTELRYPYYDKQGKRIGFQNKDGSIKELDRKSNLVDGYGNVIEDSGQKLAPEVDEMIDRLVESWETYEQRDKARRYDTIMEQRANRPIRHTEKQKLAELDEELRPKHEPVKVQIKKGLTDLPGMEYLKPLQGEKYRKPWDMAIFYSPEVRERNRALYSEYLEADKKGVLDSKARKRAHELHDELFEHHPIYGRFKVLKEQARRNIEFWVKWYKIADQVTSWHLRDLESPEKLPEFISENLQQHRQLEKRRENFVVGELEKSDKPGLFQRVKDKHLENKENLRRETIRPPLPEFEEYIDNKGAIHATPEGAMRENENDKRWSWIDEL